MLLPLFIWRAYQKEHSPKPNLPVIVTPSPREADSAAQTQFHESEMKQGSPTSQGPFLRKNRGKWFRCLAHCSKARSGLRGAHGPRLLLSMFICPRPTWGITGAKLTTRQDGSTSSSPPCSWPSSRGPRGETRGPSPQTNGEQMF